MSTQDPRMWLIAWFRQRAPECSMPDTELAACNFFDAGLIDSFGVIELISDLEAEFTIRFDQHHFQDRRFPTIAGLEEMIPQLRKET